MSATGQIQLSKFDFNEFIEAGFSAIIPAHPGKLKLPGLPVDMPYRTIYVYLEGVASIPGSDFEIVAQVELRRNGHMIHSIPASLANNPGGLNTVSQTRFTAFPNVTGGTLEGLYAVLSTPFAGGASNTTLTPQKINAEIDEVWLSILGSAISAGTFSAWRGLLAVRSSKIPT